jgi:cell surface protein SprA
MYDWIQYLPPLLRFATLDLVRGDWRYLYQTLRDQDIDNNPDVDGTTLDVNAVNVEENSSQ